MILFIDEDVAQSGLLQPGQEKSALPFQSNHR